MRDALTRNGVEQHRRSKIWRIDSFYEGIKGSGTCYFDIDAVMLTLKRFLVRFENDPNPALSVGTFCNFEF